MLKKILATVILIAAFIAFLVVFGGIAIIDISIKLMWLAFSAIMAFAFNSLGRDFYLDKVNKLLAKQMLLDGTVTVSEAPSIKMDRVILYNLSWCDANGKERLFVHEVEIRAGIVQILLSIFKKDKFAELLKNVQEIILRQPHLKLEYTLDNHRLLPQYVDELRTETAEAAELAVAAGINKPALEHLKLYLERGIFDLSINDNIVRLENINGVWRNDPVIEYHISCQLEDENISLQNQNGCNRFLVRAAKISLRKVWNIIKPIVGLKNMDLADGEISDVRVQLERNARGWSICSVSWNLSDISLSSGGLLLEDLDGKFISEDLRTFVIKRLEMKLYSHTIRVDGTVSRQIDYNDAFVYDLKLRSDRLLLKNGLEINIFDGFHISGSVGPLADESNLDLQVKGMLRVDFPGSKLVCVEDFNGSCLLKNKVLYSQGISCKMNGKPITIDSGRFELESGDYELQLKGEGLDVELLTDQPISGSTFVELCIKGQQSDDSLSIEGCYRIENIVYKGLPLSHITGKLSFAKNGLELMDNHWHIMNMNIPIECRWQDNAVHINWGDSLKRFASESALAKAWQKLKNNL